MEINAENRARMFMVELEKLCKEYGVVIEDLSCGCCGYSAIYDSKTSEKITGFNGAGEYE